MVFEEQVLQLSNSDYLSIAAIIATIVVPSVGAVIAGIIHFVGKTREDIANTNTQIAVLTEKLTQGASQAQIAVVETKLAESASKAQVAVIEAKVDLIMFKIGIQEKKS